MEKHKKFLDGAFEVIINHPYPVSKYLHWKNLEEEYNKDYEGLKKYEKLSKYQVQKYEEENKFSEVDKLLLSMKPNKRQFEFVK